MQIINEQFCYSPRNPEAYGRQVDKGYTGHGIWFKDDLPVWNLLWLSIPELDFYLDQSRSLNEILVHIDHEFVGAVAACAHVKCVHAFPGLREALGGPPDQFRAFFRDLPWQNFPPYQHVGSAWISNVSARLRVIGSPGEISVAEQVKTKTAQSTAMEIGRVGNVRYYDFRKKT